MMDELERAQFEANEPPLNNRVNHHSLGMGFQLWGAVVRGVRMTAASSFQLKNIPI